MRKQLLGLCAATLTLAAAAQNSGIEFQWGKLIDGTTTAGDQSTDVCLDAVGNVYWLGTFGTVTGQQDITFGGDFLFTGAPYEGTSNNPNYTLIKTDADGNRLWVAYSSMGDFENNAGGCAATSDGGVVTVSKFRHTDNMTDRNVVLVSADGQETEIDWTIEGSTRIYRMMVNKLSADGNFEWTRTVEFSTEPGPNASGNYTALWSNCFNVGGCAVDDNDNIYIALNYRNPMTVAKADGTTVTFTPRNNTAWTGDSQNTVGDFMILSLDKDGYYRAARYLDGTAEAAYCQSLEWYDGKLYAYGYIKGDGTELKAGDFTLAPSAMNSPVVMCTDADLHVEWAKCFPCEEVVAGKSGLQNVGITLCNNTLWLAGMYNQKITDPDNAENFVAATQGTLREGFIIKLNAANGEWLAARNSRDDDWNNPSAAAKTGLTGYFKVLQNSDHPEKVFVFGYVMNAAVGVFLREYDAETLVANLEDGQNNIVTGGGAPSCQVIAYDNRKGCAYITARGNKAFTCGDYTTDAPAGWGILAAKFQLPESMITTSSEAISVEAAATDAPVEYYNLQGVRVANPSNGLYIRRQGSSVSKVIL